MKIKFSKINHFLFCVILIELVLGGSGRFTAIGGLTLRMVLFLVALMMFVFSLFVYKKIEKYVIEWMTLFLLLMGFGVFVGVINNASFSAIFEDIKPMTFFLLLPFISQNINTKKQLKNTVLIITYGAVVLALFEFIFVYLLYTKIVNIDDIYLTLRPYDQIKFRGKDGFIFYKGFVFLCIGYLFFLTTKGKWNRFFGVLVFLAIVLTLTRGFLLFTVVITVFYILLIKPSFTKFFIFTLLSFIGVYFYLPTFMASLGNKKLSDSIRFDTISEVLQELNPISFFTGHGLGIGVPLRPIHMEISYLEIFHKQGVLGLMFWGLFFFYSLYIYLKLYKDKELFKIATPFFLSILFIYLQSLTNPYITNPMGLIVICVGLVVLKKMRYFYI